MNVFFKVNQENVVTTVITSNNREEEGYILSPINDLSIMGAIWNGSEFIYGESHTPFSMPTSFVPIYNTKQEIEQKIQEILNDKARSFGYDSMLSAVSYTNSTNDKYRMEGIALSAWRDEVWTWLYSQFENAIDDNSVVQIPMDVLLSQIPAFVMPG